MQKPLRLADEGALVVPPQFATAHEGQQPYSLVTGANRRGLLWPCGLSSPRSGGSSQGPEAAISAPAALCAPGGPATHLHRRFVWIVYLSVAARVNRNKGVVC